jgi:hypothetical protein
MEAIKDKYVNYHTAETIKNISFVEKPSTNPYKVNACYTIYHLLNMNFPGLSKISMFTIIESGAYFDKSSLTVLS